MTPLKVVKDRLQEILSGIRSLETSRVLIGIPEENATREDAEGAPANNAMLGYIHEFGAPEQNIPARPFLLPGVRKAGDRLAARMKSGASKVLRGAGSSAIEATMEGAGMIAASAAKKEIEAGNYVPLSPATIRSRRYSRQTKSRRKAEDDYLDLVANGASPAEAQSAAGIKPLINTGQLLKSITYVVAKK